MPREFEDADDSVTVEMIEQYEADGDVEQERRAQVIADDKFDAERCNAAIRKLNANLREEA